MSQPHAIATAKFIRDLLDYNEQLIIFDRSNIPQNDFDTSYIVVNTSGISSKQSSGSYFNDVTEIMNYNESYAQNVIIEMYGDDAYTNARNLSLLVASQKAADLKRQLHISISRVKNTTDVKQILGGAYGNRVHLEMTVNYCPSIDVSTLRVDTAEFEFSED